MSNLFKAGTDVHDRMKELIKQYHPDLIMVIDEIGILFREKCSTSGGQRVLGKSYKPSPAATALYNGEYKFILELPSDVWEHELGSRERDAMLDHLLCSITAEPDKETAEPVCAILRPDLVGFKENIQRFGMWYPKDPEAAEDTTVGPEIEEVVENA